MAETHACDRLISRPHMFAPSHCRFAGTIPDADGVSWWCKRHTPEARDKRQAVARERFDRRRQREKQRTHRINCYPGLLAALVKIADPAGWSLPSTARKIAQDAIRKAKPKP